MNINLHIERLVLDNVPLEHGQHASMQAAVEAELTTLLSTNGLASDLRSGGAMHFVRGGNAQLNSQTSPSEVGQQIAKAVYGGIGQ